MKNILVIQYGNIFKIFLTIKIEKKDEYWNFSSEKMKVNMESSDLNLESAREEFSDIINAILKKTINEKKLFSLFKYLGIKQKPESQIIKEKTEEILLNRNKRSEDLYVNQDELMSKSFVNINREKVDFQWTN